MPPLWVVSTRNWPEREIADHDIVEAVAIQIANPQGRQVERGRRRTWTTARACQNFWRNCARRRCRAGRRPECPWGRERANRSCRSEGRLAGWRRSQPLAAEKYVGEQLGLAESGAAVGDCGPDAARGGVDQIVAAIAIDIGEPEFTSRGGPFGVGDGEPGRGGVERGRGAGGEGRKRAPDLHIAAHLAGRGFLDARDIAHDDRADSIAGAEFGGEQC